MTDLDDIPCECGSILCKDCLEQTQASFCRATKRHFKGFQQPVLLNIIPSNSNVAYEDTENMGLLRRRKQLHSKLSTSLPDDVLFAGALDISLNVSKNEQPQWSVHCHGILSRVLTPSELRPVKKAFPRNPIAGNFKPVMQKRIILAELRSTAEYCYKRFFTKRSSFIANPKSKRKPYRDSRSQRLSAKEDELLQLALKNIEVGDPFILIGLKRKRSSDPTEIRFMRTRYK